jgi:hypothetical protein
MSGILAFTPVRLACISCERDDCDGITEDELAWKVANGWAGVSREQTWKESATAYKNPEDAPPGYSVFDWWTHLGYCPDCTSNQ